MNLRDEIASEVGHGDHLLNVQTADAIIALVRAYMTSDEAVIRFARSWTMEGRIAAAILAALGESE